MSEFSAMIKFPPKPVSEFARNTDAPGEIPRMPIGISFTSRLRFL
jgi:hypothetical protein